MPWTQVGHGDMSKPVKGSDGGFRGAAWDDGHDVEYTFYGLGSLALLVARNP